MGEGGININMCQEEACAAGGPYEAGNVLPIFSQRCITPDGHMYTLHVGQMAMLEDASQK